MLGDNYKFSLIITYVLIDSLGENCKLGAFNKEEALHW